MQEYSLKKVFLEEIIIKYKKSNIIIYIIKLTEKLKNK